MISDKNPLIMSQIKLWRERIRPSISTSFNSSPDDKLGWAPASNMITLGNLFTHISECSEWWFEQVINQGKTEKPGNVRTKIALTRPEIAGYLDAHWDRLERFFSCDSSILKRDYKVAGRENAHLFDGYWIFTHILEHDIHHRSQINQYLRILGIEPPRI